MRCTVTILVSLSVACSFEGTSIVDDDPDDPQDPSASGVDAGLIGPDVPFDNCASDNPLEDNLGEITCLGPAEDPAADPLVALEHAFEIYNGVESVHVRLTFNPQFNDNTYGTGSIGWGNKAHKFTELVGSDHARLFLYDAGGDLVFNLKLDYISEDSMSGCGYSSLGPFGGDGAVDAGDEADVLGWMTSLDENLNARGYCLTVDSPTTNVQCTSAPDAPDWDYRVVYDVWVALDAFAPGGFGFGNMESVHASPSKGESTVEVTPIDCPDGGTDGCLDPDGCDPGDPCHDVECDAGDVCSGGACVPIID